MARSTYFDLGRSADACPGSESGYAQRFQCGNIVKRRIWTRMIRVRSTKLGAMLGEGLPERSPHLYEWPFLVVSSSIHSRADVTSECCASDKPGPTRLAPSANHAREIAGSRAL